MPIVPITKAASLLGYSGTTTLYRLRDKGELSDYIRPTGIELEPPNLPSLRDHIDAILANRGQRDRGSSTTAEARAKYEAALLRERHRALRLRNDVAEGHYIHAGELAAVLSCQFTAAASHFRRLPLQLAQQALGMGLPPSREFALRELWTEAIDQALEEWSTAPVPPPGGPTPPPAQG